MDGTIVAIRPATTADAAALRQVSIETFIDTYAVYNTPANMHLYIDTYFNPQRVLDEINSPAIQFYLAFAGAELVGYIKLRTEDNPPQLEGVKHIEIERIYVLPGHKGLKIGQRLINHAAATAKQQGYAILWLGVWEKNENAIAFYKKQGFTIFGEHDFVLGTDAQRDWLMKKDIL